MAGLTNGHANSLAVAAAVGTPNVAAVTALATPTVRTVDEPLAEVVSPSMVKKYLRCPASWYFKYVEHLADPPTGNLVVGRALHEAVKENFRQKVQSKVDLPEHAVIEAFNHAWESEIEGAELRYDDDEAALKEMGAALVRKYHEEAAPHIQPAYVEHPVSGVIGGVKVRGFVDLMDTSGRIIDLKSASRSPSGIEAEHALQLTTYAMITPGASGECRLDTVTKTRTIQLVQQTHRVGPAERRFAVTTYPALQDAMREGIYYPIRSGNLCSRKYCGFWRACEREFGGTVKE